MTSGEFSWLRSCTVALVLAAHTLALAVLLLPALPFAQADVPSELAAALSIRLYHANPIPRSTASPARVARAMQTRARRAKQPTAHAAQVDAADDRQPARANPQSTSTPAAAAASVDYIAHGMPPSRTSQFGRQNTHIPGGGSADPRGNRFPMVDPRSQGLAGIVRMIGSWGGAINPHCLDEEAWRAMTPAERSDNHVSTDVMDQTAAAYRCLPQDAVSDFIKRPPAAFPP